MRLKAFRSKRSGVVYNGFSYHFIRLQARVFGHVLCDFVRVTTFWADTNVVIQRRIEPFTKQDAAGLVGSGWSAGK